MTLSGKVVVVTGGTGALGTSLVKALLLEEAEVAVTWRPPTDWDAFHASLDAPEDLAGFRCDLTSEQEVAAMAAAALERFGRVDVLVNVAGGWEPGGFEGAGLAALRAMLDVNLVSAYLATRAFLPGMVSQGEGRVVFVGAIPGLDPDPGSVAYSIAKAGVLHLARAVAAHVRGKGVTANAVVPSTILTDKNKAWGSPEEVARWVTPHEVAAAILFLASPEASGVNGAILRVPGGL